MSEDYIAFDTVKKVMKIQETERNIHLVSHESTK